MNPLRCILLLPFATTLALGQAAPPSDPADQPRALVTSLYHEVIDRRPIGVPHGRDMKVFAPYLSKALLHKMSLADACAADWYRQHPHSRDPQHPEFILKPEYGWLELGTFSGGDDEGELRAFHIERTQAGKDGSFQVHLRLTWGMPPEKPWLSYVALVVRRENGRYVVDDLLYLKDNHDVESRLSKILSEGCNGSHWVGYRGQ